jgi:hypothetical protein
MANHDSLVRFRDAAFDCNQAAKNAAALFPWLVGGTGKALPPDPLPFPRGTSLPGRIGEPFEDAVSRGGAKLWFDELHRAMDEFKSVAWPAVPNGVLDEIKMAAVSLRSGAVQIGVDSHSTAHEAAYYRASLMGECWEGRRPELPEGVTVDLHGRIEAEFLEAQRLRDRTRIPGPQSDGPWSQPDTPTRWAKAFGVNAKTFKRWVKKGKIRVNRLSDRSYQIHVDDVPHAKANPAQ